MKVDLNDVVAKFDPWELTIVIDGAKHPVKPVLFADLAKMAMVQVTQADQFNAAVSDLFDDPKPDLTKRSSDELQAITALVGEYAKSRALKNSQKVALLVAGETTSTRSTSA